MPRPKRNRHFPQHRGIRRQTLVPGFTCPGHTAQNKRPHDQPFKGTTHMYTSHVTPSPPACQGRITRFRLFLPFLHARPRQRPANAAPPARAVTQAGGEGEKSAALTTRSAGRCSAPRRCARHCARSTGRRACSGPSMCAAHPRCTPHTGECSCPAAPYCSP